MRTSRDSFRWVALGTLVAVVLVGCGGGGDSHPNSPPIAVVGAAQTVAKRSLVTLDGSGSHDPDGNSITYSWTQTAGPSVVLSSTTAVKPQFTAPGVSASLSFSLTVNDGQPDKRIHEWSPVHVSESIPKRSRTTRLPSLAILLRSGFKRRCSFSAHSLWATITLGPFSGTVSASRSVSRIFATS